MEDEKKNEIVKKEETKLAKPTLDLPESIADFGVEDLRLSSMFICQDQSNKARDIGIKPGNFYDNVTMEEHKELDTILVYCFTTRILYGDDIGDPLKCYSQDGKIPSAPNPVNSNCITCEENIKPNDKIKKGESRYGKCNRTFNFACILPNVELGSEKDFPFILPMQRSNATTAKNIINLAFRKRQELYAVTRQFRTKETKGERGRYYSLDFIEIGKTENDDIERAKYWLKFIKQMIMAQKLIVTGDLVEKDVTPGKDGDIPF
jgi:hypothetical protein